MSDVPARPLVLLVLLTSPLRAAAQAAAPADVPPTPDVPPATDGTPATDVTPPTDVPAATGAAPALDPEARYHLAFELLAEGEAALAAEALRELIAAAPEHPLALRAAALLEQLERHRPPPPPTAEATPPGDARGTGTMYAPGGERPTGSARAEFLFFQTVHGIALGAELCTMAECDGTQPWVAALMLGGGLGFGASYVLSEEGVTPGLARALTDGVWFGLGNGLALMAATDEPRGPDEEVTVASFLLGGQLLGLGVGALAYSELRPTAGQVSLTLSGSIWSSVITAELLGMAEADGNETWGGALFAAINVGALAGGYFASREPMSAGRVLLIDAGGLLGTVGGAGVALLVQDDDPEPTPTFGVALLGTAVGLATAYALTDGWRDGEAAAPVYLAVTPTEGGLAATLAGRF